jgi:hypothetical protein
MIASYSGSIQEGTLHGRGNAVYVNGERFDGDWVHGKREGQVRNPAVTSGTSSMASQRSASETDPLYCRR